MAAIPAVVALLSWAFLRERVGLRVWGAVACAALGIAMLALAKPAAQSGASAADHALGNLLVFGAVLCEASYAVIGKKLTGALAPRRITSLINLWGFALVTPFGVYQALQFDFASVRAPVWGLLLFYSLAASVWTVWLWMTGLKLVPAAQAGVFTVMLPVSAAAVGVAVLGEPFTGAHAAAFALALAGVVLATWPRTA
jgi:drug/metabolite transporter (DMT)-like permease